MLTMSVELVGPPRDILVFSVSLMLPVNSITSSCVGSEAGGGGTFIHTRTNLSASLASQGSSTVSPGLGWVRGVAGCLVARLRGLEVISGMYSSSRSSCLDRVVGVGGAEEGGQTLG